MLEFLFTFIAPPLILLGIVSLIIYLVRHDRPLLEYTMSHWQQSLAGLQGSATDFYAAIENEVGKEGIRGVVTKRVTWNEGGVFSDQREYLRIRRGELCFDICAARFGKGLFVSCWLCERPNAFLEYLLSVPGLHWVARAGSSSLVP